MIEYQENSVKHISNRQKVERLILYNLDDIIKAKNILMFI